jgi:hypothetical protein
LRDTAVKRTDTPCLHGVHTEVEEMQTMKKSQPYTGRNKPTCLMGGTQVQRLCGEKSKKNKSRR